MNRYCSCEQVAHGDLGPIGDQERLARLIVSPQHINASGQVRPGAFPLKHIGTTGLSLLRIDKMSAAEVKEIADGIAATMNGQEVFGLSIAKADQLRSVPDQNPDHRAVCALDDPVKDQAPAPDNPAHAILISTRIRAEDELLELQSVLRRIFSTPIKVADTV